MARNGSGTYSLPSNSWNPAINGAPATAADWQTLINDVASALTQSLSKDGQTPLTGNLPLGGNKITGLAAGTVAGDALSFGQTLSVADLEISGLARRITGDFSNATITNRVMFQTSTPNSQTNIGVIPSGSANGAAVQIFPTSTATNSAFGSLLVQDLSDFRISSGIVGSGSYVPMTFYTNGTEKMRLDTAGILAVPAGITSATQAPGDNTTKVATTAFVAANAVALTGAQTVAGKKSFTTPIDAASLGGTGTGNLTTYTSSVASLPVAGGSYSGTHSLGVVPQEAVLEITCTTADAGYSVGDVLTPTLVWNGSALSSLSNWKNTTAVGSAVLPTGYFTLIANKTTGASVSATAANWSYRFRLRAA